MSNITYDDKIEGGTFTHGDANEIKTAVNSKQDELVSNTHIKTVNSTTLVGAGDVAVQAVLAEGAFANGDKTHLDAIEALADVTDAANVGTSIHGVTGKTTPVDADTIAAIDSDASNVLAKVTWANVKATLKTYFDTLYGDGVVIASGTQALGTAEIADSACATVITVSATGVATTDIVTIGYNSTPVGRSGYDPTEGAELTIRAFPTANNINILVCNNTGAAVTPGAMTINWRVVR